jgi:hypothetical protein
MRPIVIACVVALAGCAQHGTQSSIDGPPSGATFRCGAETCTTASQFCVEFVGGVAPTGGCNDLPFACLLSPTCDCLKANVVPCGAGLVCGTSSNGGLTLTCEGI